MEEQIRSFIEMFRQPFQADGGDLILDRLEADKLELRIVIGENGCRECNMPSDVVESIISSNLKESFGLDYQVKVTLEDL